MTARRRQRAFGGAVAVCALLVAPAPHTTARPQSATAERQVISQADRPLPRFADPDRRQRLESAWADVGRILSEQQAAMHTPGLSWGVVIDGELARAGGLGIRGTSAPTPVTPSTVFRIASMTKSVTALAVLRLRDSGRLSLDEPVSRYVPELAKLAPPTADSPAITIRHLLTHGAGFPEDNPWGDRVLDATEQDVSAWMREGIPFSTAPGTTYEYSNYGFAILGRVVSRASGMRYRDFVQREILQPLALTETWWDPREVPPERLAAGHRFVDGRWREEPLLSDGAFGAMGGLLMSGRDLGRYIAFMLSAWPPRDEPDHGPVGRASLREMQQMARHGSLSASAADGPVRASTSGYGYGVRVVEDCSFLHIVGHSGGLPGFGSNMTWLPEYGVGVYVMANVTYAPAAVAARAVIDRLAATGGLQARTLPPAPALQAYRTALATLFDSFDGNALHGLAAENLLLDVDATTRRAQVTALRAKVGRCEPGDWVRVENWLRGRFRLDCERGAVDVTFTLSPGAPSRLQYLSFSEATAGPAAGPRSCGR